MRAVAFALLLLAALVAAQQGDAQQPVAQQPAAPYQPKSAGDKAHSEAEFGALAYMRTVVASENVYFKKHNQYAPSLQALVGTHSFTRRMANPNRGEYTVHYKPTKDGYFLTLTPRTFDAEHRAFYVDETGLFRMEESKPATAASGKLQ